MPVRLGVSLVAEKPLPLSEISPDRLHGLFFSIAGEELARELHSYSKVKPFTLSFYLQSGGKRRSIFSDGENGEVERLHIGISFLNESLFPRFLSSFVLNEQKDFYLGKFKLRKIRKPYITDKNIKSYRNLFEESKPQMRIMFEFITPTTFKKGKYDWLIPDPKLIFKGLIRKWQTFSDFGIDIDLREVVKNKVIVAGAWIGTKRIEFSDFGWVGGFTGSVILHLDTEEERALRWLNALARFAEFAGVGRKTTMGLGQVRFREVVPES